MIELVTEEEELEQYHPQIDMGVPGFVIHQGHIKIRCTQFGHECKGQQWDEIEVAGIADVFNIPQSGQQCDEFDDVITDDLHISVKVYPFLYHTLPLNHRCHRMGYRDPDHRHLFRHPCHLPG